MAMVALSALLSPYIRSPFCGRAQLPALLAWACPGIFAGPVGPEHRCRVFLLVVDGAEQPNGI